MSRQWNEELEAARRYLNECERADAAATHKEHHLESLRKAKLAFRLMSPSPEDQKRLYELLDVRVQVTADDTLVVTGELGLAAEVLGNGATNPEQLLGEMLATPSPRSSARARAVAAGAPACRARR